jgi:DNA-binding transcriptional MerR regulator
MLAPRPSKESIIDSRFTVPVFTVAEAARLVGMNPSTLSTWAKGYERRFDGRRPVRMGPVITSISDTQGRARIPFIGLVEAAVVQAFRQTDLPLQRIRAALEVLEGQGELEHALASRKLMTDGADVLYDYARETADGQLGLLTVVKSGQRVYTDMIAEYLERVTFGDDWATEIVIPTTEHHILRVRPNVASTRPLFVASGAPLDAIHDRIVAGEPLGSVARDFGTPEGDIREALDAIWPSARAA